MTAVPENGYILCWTKIPAKERILTSGGIEYDKENLPVYEVISDSGSEYASGDLIICASTGMEIGTSGFKLFKRENIAAKILEQ